VVTNPSLGSAPLAAAAVEFESQPGKAKISEDGIYLGETPLKRTFAAGRHRITAQYEDWPALTEEVLVRVGENATKQFYLPHGTAQFKIEPEGSRIFVNGNAIDGLRKPMQPGTYRVRVEHPGYEPYETTIAITEREVANLTASLKPMLGFVEFSSDPPGAAIFEAKTPDKEIGRTQPGQPLRRSFPPGAYAFIARYDGLDPVLSKPVDVSVGTTISLPLTFDCATVQFNSEPAGADLLIGEQKIKTPYLHRQKPGRVAYRIELQDYEPVQGSNDLAAGAAVPVLVRLRPKEVSVALSSDPPNAEFYLADTPLRSTNGVYKLPWGSHTITARYRGLDAKTNLVAVDKSGSSSTNFVFDYATIEITNAETKLLLNDQVVAAGAGRIYVRPDVRYDFALESLDSRTNLPIQLAVREIYRPVLASSQMRRTFTNSIGIVLVRVGGMPNYPNGFWVGKYEVREGEYLKLMAKNYRPEPLPMARGAWRRGIIVTNTFRVDATHPQVMVTAQQASEFCAKLTEMEKASGKLPPGSDYYSLPTEEQWEYFVADTQLDDAITSKGRSPPRTKPEPVGTHRANRYGLYDVRGNVWELCLAQDGSPWMRGGAFDGTTDSGVFGTLAVAYRNQAPASPSPVVGFRVVCVPGTSAPAQK
jgi:hypothetical protein